MDIIVVKLAIWSILLLILKLNATTDINSLLTSYCSTPSECQINEYDGEADSTNEADAPETKSLQCLACSCDSFCSYKKNCCPTKRMGVKGMLSKSDAGFEMSVDSERGNAPKSADSDMIGMSEPILNFSCIIPRSNVEQTDGPTASVAEGLGLYMVTSCKQGFRDQRCTESTVDVLEQNLPQTSLNTSITYRNTFCGECNNDTELVSWKPYITCSDSYLLKADQLLFPISVEKLYQLAISSEDGECGIEFRPPDNFDQSRDMCYKNELVQTCTSNNILLLSACKSFSMPFFHKESNVTIAYANVFCYLCQNNSQLSANHFDEILKFPTMANALVGELNIDNENARDIEEFTFLAREIAERYDSHCEPGHVFDPFEGNCRLWYCPTESTALKSACVPILKKVETATYQVRLTVEPENDTEDYFRSFDSSNLTSNLLSAMFKNGDNAETETILIAGNQTGLSLFIVVLMQISSANDETRLFRLENFNRTYNVSVDPNCSLMVNVKLAIGIVLEIVTYPNWNIQVFDTMSYDAMVISYISDNILKVYEYPILEKLAFCLQIMLEKYEFADLIGAIRLGRSGIKLYTGEFIRVFDSRKARVCYDDYVKNAPERLFQHTDSSATQSQVITSVVCTSMSITCLCVTILTYAIFSDLRTIPGKINILLSVHLLIAQCLYQFTFTETDNPRLCIAFGIMIHFFWLTSILWMSACTVNMFRTFVTKKSFRSTRSCEPQVCMYALYCYVLAGIPVGINIGISLKESDGNLIGYGGQICYISNPLMVGLTFALPVGIIVILNMIFFLIVMYKISESTMRFRKSIDRTNSIIYMKLSSLTGTTWIFGYIYLWTEFEPLEFAFIVLNAGQGVLIFFSFVCNAKVFHLYQELFSEYSRRLLHMCCKSNVERSNPKQPSIDIGVKASASLKSAEFNKTNLSADSPAGDGLHLNPDQLPACLTVVKPDEFNGPVVVVKGYELDGIVTKGISEIPAALAENN